MEPRVQYARASDGIRIAVQTLGNGVPLILVPPGPWSIAELEWQLPQCEEWYARLAQDNRIVRYDMRGTGHSDRTERCFDLDSRRLDLEAVVEFTGAKCIGLFAAQHAGPIAIQYAAANPQRVTHLLLWCTYARGADYFDSAQSRALHGVQSHDWSLFTETVSHAHTGWAESALARRLATLLRRSVTHEMIRAFDTAAGRLDVTSQLAGIRAATTIFHRRSVSHPNISISRELAATIREAELVVLDGDSIVPFVEPTDKTIDAVNRALGHETPRPPVPAPPPSTSSGLAEPLSDRELEVLQLVAAGLSNREIGATLFISVGTVKTHMISVFGKLEVHSRTRAVARARECGLLPSRQ